jgi:periplasmic divalent cation tolerance protein
MTDALVVLCTCSDEQEALRIANALIEARVAACVNLLPAIQSVYRWEGKIETAREVLLLIKTTRERFSELSLRIVQLHSYQTPEIVAVGIDEGLEKYLVWLRGQL